MNLYFVPFLAPIWPISSPIFTFNCVREGSNRPPFAYFLLIQHLLIFSGTLLKKQKDGQHLAERRAKKARKAAEKRRTKVPRNRTHVAETTPTKPAHLAGQQSGTTVPLMPCWGVASSVLARWRRALGHNRAILAPRRDLNFPAGLFWRTFSFMLIFMF